MTWIPTPVRPLPMKRSKAKLRKPRVLIPFNTGTRVIPSKKDKARQRRNLNKLTKEEE